MTDKIIKTFQESLDDFYDFLPVGKVEFNKSPARTPKASAILYNTSREKGRTMFGASMELRCERLIFAFSANFS